jgi:hypothetical protein
VKKNSTVWIDRGWQPVLIGYVPSEAAWNRTVRQYNINSAWPEITKGGGWSQLLSNSSGAIILVCVSDEGVTEPVEIVLTIVHEAAHVWQFLRSHICETAPGLEMEAYGIEAITRGLISAYCQTQGFGKSLPVIKRGKQ